MRFIWKLGREVFVAFLMLTDVDAVYAGWETPEAQALRRATPEELRTHSFAPGSMGPKVQAGIEFVESGGERAGIGSLEDAAAILGGKAGTFVSPEAAGN